MKQVVTMHCMGAPSCVLVLPCLSERMFGVKIRSGRAGLHKLTWNLKRCASYPTIVLLNGPFAGSM